jgi:uncharacterized beta-barrel protein YwiB (DUF1934 family)
MQDGNIIITVSGSGELAGDEKITTRANGKLYTKNGSRYILYEIFEEDAKDVPIKHTLKLYNNTMEMTKSNPAVPDTKSKIIYRPGTRSETSYATPYGILKLTFDTQYLSVKETDNRLEVCLRYKILMNEDVLSRNQLEIFMEPITPAPHF